MCGKPFTIISLVCDVGFVCRGPELGPAVCASQVRQRTSVFKPAIHTHLDVTVDIPAQGAG